MWSALGRHPGPHAGHRLDRCPVPGNPAAPHALSHPCSAGGWRFRVRRRLRAGLPAMRPALVRFATAISQLNGAVERAQRTHTEEFYQVTACSLEMKKLNRELRQWERIYNTMRPHQSLGYLTPQQFLLRGSSQRKE